ncbi:MULTISPECIES: hemerythrin domain-containing protein [Ramlibacter]|uniref:Hemerythrin domain-containing protein n=1 Tax=Ramlibacter aquaticus TaxID=2780094 RepID=A0ABR9SHT3_9BURK|nr:MULTISPECIES: hemerythrin domain-containing protein [Ramlibacter]MBE7941918.1 hemerythrin domain-containing protein [Ramlibacter aquaticus]
MPTLNWSAALEIEYPAMDDTHREFVELLAACEAAADAALPAAWDEFIAHTEEHFGQEDRWMESTGFSTGNCHSTQHKVVLQVLREGAQRMAAGDSAPTRQMIRELAAWFPQHAQSMDAALALHLRSVGFDPATGACDRLPAQALHGCGGASCGG